MRESISLYLALIFILFVWEGAWSRIARKGLLYDTEIRQDD